MKKWKGEGVCITLLGNLHCNFQCDHCCYMSGPNAPNKWMPERIVQRAWEVRNILLKKKIRVEWNLIGGEITYGDDMEWLERTLNFISQDWDPVNIVTNGWWLTDVEACRRFFNIIRPYCPDDGIMADFTVRISNDVHHDQFRPHWLTYNANAREDRLKSYLRNLLEGMCDEYHIFYEPYYFCGTCDTEYDEYQGGRCPKCDDWLEIDDREMCERLPVPHPHGPYIHVDDHDPGYKNAWPTGRAKGFGALTSGYCSVDDLVVRPDGQIWDYCCRGGQLRFGTVFDDPLKLLSMAYTYTEEVKPTCQTCYKTAARWLKEHSAG